MNMIAAIPRAVVELSQKVVAVDPVDLSDVVEVIGTEGFAATLLAGLNRMVGAECCAIYQMKDYAVSRVVSAAQDDYVERDLERTSYDVKRLLNQACATDVKLEIDSSTSTSFEPKVVSALTMQKRQWIMISGRRANARYCIQIVRPLQFGCAADAAVDQLRGVARLLMAIAAKHSEMVSRKPNMTPALSSLVEIEACILGQANLTRREAEVCARILYGLSSCGIALDLGIGKESVMTYRKRAYQRLGIASQRELLMWYLARWSVFRSGNKAMSAALSPA